MNALGAEGDMVPFGPTQRRFTRAAGQFTRAAEQNGHVDHSPLEGRARNSCAKKVLTRGRCIVEGSCWTGRKGAGLCLRRGGSAPI